MPSCDQTGVCHFHSSTICGSASLMIARIRPSFFPRQSAYDAILSLINLAADALSCLAARFIVGMIRTDRAGRKLITRVEKRGVKLIKLTELHPGGWDE